MTSTRNASLKEYFGKLFGIVLAMTVGVPGAFARDIKFVTSSAVYTDMLEKTLPVWEKKSGNHLQFIMEPTKPTGSDLTIRLVLDGKCEAAAASIPFSDWTKLVEKDPAYKDKVSKLTHRVIGKNLIHVIAHKGIGVTSLTHAQLAEIFAGKAMNWKEFGGNDVPIRPMIEKTTVARNKIFAKATMRGKPYRSDIQHIEGGAKVLEATILSTPGAITSYSKDSVSKGEIQLIRTEEEIGRPITLITVGRPSDELQDLIQFLATDGKKLETD